MTSPVPDTDDLLLIPDRLQWEIMSEYHDEPQVYLLQNAIIEDIELVGDMVGPGELDLYRTAQWLTGFEEPRTASKAMAQPVSVPVECKHTLVTSTATFNEFTLCSRSGPVQFTRAAFRSLEATFTDMVTLGQGRATTCPPRFMDGWCVFLFDYPVIAALASLGS
jgi:hypothetical protein